MADDDIVALGTELKLVDAEEESFDSGGNVNNRDSTKGERSKSVSDLPSSAVSSRHRNGTSVCLPTCRDPQTVTTADPDTPRRHELQKSSSKKDLFNPLECPRLFIRRNALCDPEKMPMPQLTRERIQRDVETRRKSLSRKLSNYLSVHLNLGKEEDLI